MKLAAVIVETRPLPNLIEIIKGHQRHLPEHTLYVFGSIAVESMLKDIDCTFVQCNMVINEAEYNKLLTSKMFWDIIEEENVLIFQHDSMLLRSGIEEFYGYDYVGAPWSWCLHGGNGGLSLRKKSAMLMAINAISYNQSLHGNEDVYYSNYLVQNGNLAPREVCEKFSCEAIFKLGALGYHAIDKWLTKDQIEQIKNQYQNAV